MLHLSDAAIRLVKQCPLTQTCKYLKFGQNYKNEILFDYFRDGSCGEISYQVYYSTGELIRRCETEGCVNLTGEIQTHVIPHLNRLNTENCEVDEDLTISIMDDKLSEG